MTVLVFNDRFSPNVGDGLLAACLEGELREQLGGETVHTVDVDGKTRFPSCDRAAPASALNPRQLASAVLPESLGSAVAATRVRRRLRRIIAPVANARAFVIGGGHLINGSGLYFPLRIRTLARLARGRGASLFVQSVGVTDPRRWKRSAAGWLREAFERNPDLRFVSVRDPLSARYWTEAFPNSPPPVVCPDPGLLARKVFAPSGPGESPPCIGVGVIAHRVASRLASDPQAVHVPSRFYVELCRALSRRGRRPCLFTNGDPEDHVEAEKVFERVRHDDELRSAVQRCPRPADERELVGTIARFRGVIAHRMHATIAAYSLGIPAVGLAWDKKLESFFRSVRRERFLIGDPSTGPERIAERLDEACRCGIAEDERHSAVRDAEKGVRMLADELRADRRGAA